MTYQPQYYQALGSADAAADSTVFITFMLNSILQTLGNSSQTDQVSEQVESLLAAMPEGWVNSVELMALLKLSHKPTFRKNYLLSALEHGYIEMFHPDSPRSPKQKYRRVLNHD